ncbi:unnamed protein product [Sphenostylis stenocarpa]|uniref:glucan endo-1,3-beta-D-glucosidase n=1 Tax=Sphenostylis stenocarpa TaxID=92480 RepID=A0AA86SME1_9FABA|nr:unnamed protein product [Sphenostylis stenocarpa]
MGNIQVIDGAKSSQVSKQFGAVAFKFKGGFYKLINIGFAGGVKVALRFGFTPYNTVDLNMFVRSRPAISAILVFLGILSSITDAIGVCYVGDSLESRQEVVELYKRNDISRMRIYFPDEEALEALRGSNIELIMDVAKETIHSLTDPKVAIDWVNKYVTPYSQDVKFKYISVGNEIHPGDNETQYILSAMTNIHNAISLANLQARIKVSTAIDTSLIGASYPPSAGDFTMLAKPYMKPIIEFLVSTEAPILANVYPYFSYASDPSNIGLDYALFTQQANNSVGYQNLFDAMMDAIYGALEKVGASSLQIVVSETGWPSKGEFTSAKDASTYYTKLINHVSSGIGTPKRPGRYIETYLFSMFNGNQKQDRDNKQFFGLFSPDKSPNYQLSFN